MTEFEGGTKSLAHIWGQIRLERVYQAHGFKTNQEDRTPCINTSGNVKDFQVDVMICNKNFKAIMALEVDTYTYKIKGAKSVPNMRNRDKLIEEQHKVPVIRYDIDALKEGRHKTKYYMTDQELYDYGLDKYKEYLIRTAVKIKYTVVN